MPHTRGSDDWAMTELNSRAIGNLLQDLKKLDRTGYDDAICKEVRDALETLIKAAKAPKSAVFLPVVTSDLDQFYQAYKEWNSHGTKGDPDAIDSRRERLEELTNIRKRIQRALSKRRKAGATPVSSGDREIVIATFDQFRAMVQRNPDYFSSLKGAVERFDAKIAA